MDTAAWLHGYSNRRPSSITSQSQAEWLRSKEWLVGWLIAGWLPVSEPCIGTSAAGCGWLGHARCLRLLRRRLGACLAILLLAHLLDKLRVSRKERQDDQSTGVVPGASFPYTSFCLHSTQLSQRAQCSVALLAIL